MIASDTASYSDLVFGIFTLLGYRFTPASDGPGGPVVQERLSRGFREN